MSANRECLVRNCNNEDVICRPKADGMLEFVCADHYMQYKADPKK